MYFTPKDCSTHPLIHPVVLDSSRQMRMICEFDGMVFLMMYLFYVFMHLPVCVYVRHIHAVPEEARRGGRIPGTRVTDG